MKALTVRQPWTWAIAYGGKTIENRSPGAVRWQPRIDLAIHAGSTWSGRGASDPRVKFAWIHRYGTTPITPEGHEHLALGQFLALVDLVDVHPDAFCCRPWGESSYAHANGTTVRNVTHLVLDNVRVLGSPVLWTKGRLGLWTVPEGVEEKIRGKIAA